MKVYFTTGYENPKKSKANIDYIIDTLKKHGHGIIKRPLKSGHGADTYGVNEGEINEIFDFLDRPLEKIYTEATARIRNADVVIAEASYFVSPGMGFELGYALHEKKPVLVLINKESNIVLSEVIEGNPSKLFFSSRYEDHTDLGNKISEFLKEAKQRMDSKYILIISPEIDKYLEWASAERRMHKAQLVRNSIEDTMTKDKEYKQFLNEIGVSD